MPDYKSIVLSPYFNFLVGPDRSCITIQSGLIGGLSEPLNALIKNGMLETQSRVAAIEDVDVEIFVGFCEFAYTGKYTSPKAVVENNADEQISGPVGDSVRESAVLEDFSVPTTADETSWGSFGKKDNKKKKLVYHDEDPLPPSPSRSSTLWQAFLNLKLTYEHDHVKVQPSNHGSHQLLYHAKLYVFAERYLVECLKTCCLANLHTELLKFELTATTYVDILDLLSFTYENTNRRGSSGADRLRELVIYYVACKADHLVRDDAFRSVLDTEGEMGSDLVHRLLT